MAYVDGFLLVVPTKKLKAYEKMARIGARVWKDHGALEYRECVGDDLAVKFGRPFPKTLKLKRGETAVFSWIVYKSKAHRDAVNKKVMKDKRITESMTQEMPFDVRRMNYGGFKVLVEA